MRTLIISFLFISSSFTQVQAESVNVRTSVTGTVWAERPNIRADFPLGDKLTLGAEVGNQSYDDGGVDIKGYSGGLYATLYTKGVFTHGWTVDFGLTYADFKGETAAGLDADAESFGFRVLGGYHWFWDPFNLNLAVGYASNTEDKLRVRDATGTVAAQGDLKPVALTGDVSVGLTF